MKRAKEVRKVRFWHKKGKRYNAVPFVVSGYDASEVGDRLSLKKDFEKDRYCAKNFERFVKNMRN